MGPLLSSLVDLQTVETELRQMKGKLNKGLKLVLSQQQHIKQLEGALQAKHEEIKLTRLQSSKLEIDLKERETEIVKLRVALNTARTNKDYSAILTQINTDKASKSKLEDQILALMTQIDADRAACRDIEQNIEIEQARLTEASRTIEAKHEVLNRELDKLEQQHHQAIQQVPEKERSMFERLAERFDGKVLAEVMQLNGRRGDHSCGGCYMTVPLESVNSLMTRDDLLTCPNCGRILILELNQHQQPTA